MSGFVADRPGVGVEAQVLPGAGADADAVDGGVEVEAEGRRLERRIDRCPDRGGGRGGRVDGVDDSTAGQADDAAVSRTAVDADQRIVGVEAGDRCGRHGGEVVDGERRQLTGIGEPVDVADIGGDGEADELQAAADAADRRRGTGAEVDRVQRGAVGRGLGRHRATGTGGRVQAEGGEGQHADADGEAARMSVGAWRVSVHAPVSEPGRAADWFRAPTSPAQGCTMVEPHHHRGGVNAART